MVRRFPAENLSDIIANRIFLVLDLVFGDDMEFVEIYFNM